MEAESVTLAPVPRSRAPQRPPGLDGVLTGTAWMANPSLDLRSWLDQGRSLGVVGRASGWWIGDWLRYGNLRFGERYARAARITGYDVQTLMNMVYVASAYDVSERRPELSWSHHAELAALEPEERRRWLDVAERDRLSVRCLRQEVRRERRARGLGRAPRAAARELEAGRPAATERRCPHCGAPIDAAE
jgi:signal transduction histidine kinase